MNYAILIDAGFVKKVLGNRDNPISEVHIKQLVDEISNHDFLVAKYLHRVYYYDSKPYAKSHNKPLGGEKHNFGKDPLTKHNTKMIKALERVDHVSLRLGYTQFNGWEIDAKAIPKDGNWTITEDNLRPSIQQKGVDMRIGLDIASLTLKKQVDIIVLVTADADFIPPMKFARREGVQLAIVTLGNPSAKPELFEHSDVSLEIQANSQLMAKS